MTVPALPPAFFVPDGDAYVGTAATAGPWGDHDTMHFGPAAALLGRAWRIRTAEVTVPDPPSEPDPWPAVGPDAAAEQPFFLVGVDQHYGSAVDVRFVQGGFREPGPADAWMRMRIPLVAGEAPSPLTRVLVAADSGNGLSALADPRELLFINVDLSVHLHREPAGAWVRLRSHTTLDGRGAGLTTPASATATDRSGLPRRRCSSTTIADDAPRRWREGRAPPAARVPP